MLALNTRSYDIEARASYKFGCSRSVAGTPIFFVNGVMLDGAEEWKAEDWIFYIRTNSVQGDKR